MFSCFMFHVFMFSCFHVSCFMFHVSCFHVSCFMFSCFHVSCFMFHVSCFMCFMFHVSCFMYHVSCHVSCFMIRFCISIRFLFKAEWRAWMTDIPGLPPARPWQKETRLCTAPCLLPDPRRLVRLRVVGERYWPVTIQPGEAACVCVCRFNIRSSDPAC